MTDELIRVEVAYAKPDRQKIIELDVAPGTTMDQAARASGIREHFPEIDLDQAHMGIFGELEKNPAERVLREGERVEIYRPLKMDPKELRRARAKEKRGK
jgi:putative ubiquitin-RnfH superfamily antitoxin RatB of RatAB toxin-antitoxin module